MIFDPAEIRRLIHVTTKRTGTPVHDEDLEQDIALQALEAFRRLDEITHPRALLMKIVQDTVRDYWRRRRSSEDLSNIDERFISHMPAFESTMDQERRLELLRRALHRLPESKRTLLELFYINERSIAEIAALQGRSISAVKMELARSRRLLAEIVRRLADKKPRITRISRTSSS
jgi:RNA polymerase sigma-70 factor (ECF subfamily)